MSLRARTNSRPPIEVLNEKVIRASAERVWDLLADVERWPSWWRACRWVKKESAGSFTWKAHPVVLRSTVVANDRPREFAITADGLGVHAERAFTVSPSQDGRSSVVTSHETQVGPLPWLGRLILGPRLHAVNEAMFEDLARAAMK
jgi:uncharacterized protein YndB with AHSA1/START domain